MVAIAGLYSAANVAQKAIGGNGASCWASSPHSAAALVALGLVAAGQSWRLRAASAALDRLLATVAAERLQPAEATRLASEAARTEAQRRTQGLQEITREADRNAERARTARTAAVVAAARRLHDSAADFAAGGGAAAGDPAAARPAPAAGDTARVLAQLLDQAVDEARRYAAVADERGTAGQACERSYDALIAPPVTPRPQFPTCRRLAGLHMESLDISYTVGGSARPADRRELVIWSWDQATEPAGLF